MAKMTPLEQELALLEKPDPVLANKVVTYLKSQGVFDQFRRECMDDVDTKPAYQNLRHRVEGSVAAFLHKNPWKPEMNKNQMRDNLRKYIQSVGFLDSGVDRIVDQVVNPKIYTVFLPKVKQVVEKCLELDKNNKPKFRAPPSRVVEKPEPVKFQDKHNLAPRARLPSLLAPRMPIIPNIEALKPPRPLDDLDSSMDEKQDNTSPDHDVSTDSAYLVDEDDAEENGDEDDDDEESPPFELHSENDTMILGVRSDSSEHSEVFEQIDNHDEESDDREESDVKEEEEDSDNKDEKFQREESFEEELQKDESDEKEEEEEEEEESSSDEYVLPKTPSISMDDSNESVIEFNSVSQYKKFDEESFGNVEEEIVLSQWVDETSLQMKEERSSNEENSEEGSRKRNMNISSFDDESNCSVNKEISSDDEKSNAFRPINEKKVKLEESECENERESELCIHYPENEDSLTSNPEKSTDMSDVKQKLLENNDHQETHKTSSDSSKDSGKGHHHSHRERKESSGHHHSRSEKSSDSKHREGSSSSHSSRDKTDDKHASSKSHQKDRERKRSESSSSKHSDKNKKDRSKEMDEENRRKDKYETNKKEKDVAEKDKKESQHEHKDRSRDRHDKEKKWHDKNDGKKDHDSTYRHDKDKKHGHKSSKSSHSSNKHDHRSSSEKHKSEKDQKHKESPDKRRSSDGKSEKDKRESRKKHREPCKSSEKEERRRSSDRDSNGPSGGSHTSSSMSKSSSSRHQTETSVETNERNSSNSDNTVSDNIETPHDECSKFDSVIENKSVPPNGELSENFEPVNQDSNNSKKNLDDKIQTDSQFSSSAFEIESKTQSGYDALDSNRPNSNSVSSSNGQLEEMSVVVNKDGDNVVKDLEKHDFESEDEISSLTFPTPGSSVHDTSSEKENIEQTVNYKETKCNKNDKVDNEDAKVMKFKKPKIAANIFEVKKIMQARRKLKRIEKKRTKLLTKNSPEESSSDKSSSPSSLSEGGSSPSEGNVSPVRDINATPDNDRNLSPQEEEFKGFEDDSSDKIEKYVSLINRLQSEIANINTDSNVVTPWIDLNPDLDDYIENELQGKVYRKIRIRVPPISEEHYRFDPVENAYILLDNGDDYLSTKQDIVDTNLNRLKPSLERMDDFDETESIISLKDTSDEVDSRSSDEDSEVSPLAKADSVKSLSPSPECRKRKSPSPLSKVNKLPKPPKETIDESENTIETNKVSCTVDYKSQLNENNRSNLNPIISTPKVLFSITFNQMYDEVLKEKGPDTVTKSKQTQVQTPRTVVKITSKSTDQVDAAAVQPRLNAQVPTITKSEPKVNGQHTKPSPQPNQLPLISRVNKKKSILTPSAAPAKSHRINGTLMSDSTIKSKAMPISSEAINSVIGIHTDSTTTGKASDQSVSPKEQIKDQRLTRETRQTGVRHQAQQRYDSDDLYKPRPQLGTTSRRVRGQTAQPIITKVVAPQTVTITRKRAAAPGTTSPAKRKR